MGLKNTGCPCRDRIDSSWRNQVAERPQWPKTNEVKVGFPWPQHRSWLAPVSVGNSTPLCTKLGNLTNVWLCAILEIEFVDLTAVV